MDGDTLKRSWADFTLPGYSQIELQTCQRRCLDVDEYVEAQPTEALRTILVESDPDVNSRRFTLNGSSVRRKRASCQICPRGLHMQLKGFRVWVPLS